MANKETSIINILTYKLPFDLANQIYNEYQQRQNEMDFLFVNSKRFKDLSDDRQFVERLLALSIFYKRVVACFEGIRAFHVRITKQVRGASLLEPPVKLSHLRRSKLSHQNAGEDLKFLLAER